MSGASSAPRWCLRVVSAESIARLALQRPGGHVAATRVLHDGLFASQRDASDLVYDSPDRAVLVVTIEHDGRRVGVVALADRSGRLYTIADDGAQLALVAAR